MASSSFSFNKTLPAGQSLQAGNNSYESDTHALLVSTFKVSTNNGDHNYEVVGHKAETQLADYGNDEMHATLIPVLTVTSNNVEQKVSHNAQVVSADYDNDEMHAVLKPKFKAGATETVTTETIYVEPDQLWIG